MASAVSVRVLTDLLRPEPVEAFYRLLSSQGSDLLASEPDTIDKQGSDFGGKRFCEASGVCPQRFDTFTYRRPEGGLVDT